MDWVNNITVIEDMGCWKYKVFVKDGYIVSNGFVFEFKEELLN